MDILFTYSDTFGSRLIRRVLGEPVSHTAILIGGVVHHSTLTGIRSDPLPDFMQHNHIMFSYHSDMQDDCAISRLPIPLKTPLHITYDIGAFIYMGLRSLFRWLPKKNLWSMTGLYLCTEYATSVLDRDEDSSITPYKLWLRLVDEEKKHV